MRILRSTYETLAYIVALFYDILFSFGIPFAALATIMSALGGEYTQNNAIMPYIFVLLLVTAFVYVFSEYLRLNRTEGLISNNKVAFLTRIAKIESNLGVISNIIISPHLKRLFVSILFANWVISIISRIGSLSIENLLYPQYFISEIADTFLITAIFWFIVFPYIFILFIYLPFGPYFYLQDQPIYKTNLLFRIFAGLVAIVCMAISTLVMMAIFILIGDVKINFPGVLFLIYGPIYIVLIKELFISPSILSTKFIEILNDEIYLVSLHRN